MAGCVSVKALFTEPLFLLHVLNWLMSVIIFSCVAGISYDTIAQVATPDSQAIPSENVCGFNGAGGTCSYGVGIGVVGALFCTAFIVAEVMWDKLAGHHKPIYVVEVLLSGVWALLWFVAFCIFCDGWRKTDAVFQDVVGKPKANSAIAFSFFSTLTWGYTSHLLYKAYRADDLTGDVPGQYDNIGSGYQDPVTGGSQSYAAAQT